MGDSDLGIHRTHKLAINTLSDEKSAVISLAKRS
jgi:hypothetical protein